MRAIDAAMLERLHDGVRRSVTFRHIVLALEQSNVIVYVTPGVCDSGRIAGCLLRFVRLSEKSRYLRIVVSEGFSDERIISIVGHELTHAREVAEAATVIDGVSMLALFRRTGMRQCPGVRSECYETQAAIDAEDAILRELGKLHQFFRP
ncbi:MAG: hypothetical protein ABR606_00175 [Vicinamibacterales bacterium]